VNRIPWILGFPILLDVILWLSPRLSAAPVFHRLASTLSDLYGSVTATGLDESTVTFMRERISEFDTASSSFNLLFLIPGSLAQIPSIEPPSIAGTFSLELSSGLDLLVLALGFELVGILIGCVFWGILAQQLRDGKVNVSTLPRRVGFYVLSILGFVLLAVGVSIAILIPIGVVIGLISVVSPTVGVIVLSAMGAAANILGILLVIYLYFWVDAIVISNAGPLRAAVNSGRVVANNFWSTVFFIGLVLLISRGTSLIWDALDQAPFGMVVAIAANAYVATGLTSASLLFYQTRMARLPAARGVLGRVSQT
jgi:hypothetical protein